MIVNYSKNIIKKILYNKYNHFYKSNYIVYENLLINRYRKKKIFSKRDYLYFLYKNINNFNLKSRFIKKAYILSYTIIQELSADCCHRKIGIEIENKIKNFDLKNLITIFQKTLPTGIQIKLKQKKFLRIILKKRIKLKNFIKICFSTNPNLSFKNYYTSYNIIFDLKKSKIIKVIKKKNRDYLFLEKTNYQKIENPITIKGIKSYKFISNFKFKKHLYPKEKLFTCNFISIKNINNTPYFINSNKTYSNHKNFNNILIFKNITFSFRGLISFEDFIIKESLGYSIFDPPLKIINNKILIPKITKEINSKAIIFPTAINNIGHYTFESLIKLNYLKKIQDYKIIVFDELSNYMIEILLALGIKNDQILKKKNYESWKIKELLLPIIPWFEISKNESKFLANSIINKKIIIKEKKYKKIYISRRDNTENRNLINEIEIESILRSLGFEILIASKLSIYEKINIFENSEIIITPLGSAIHNFMFCKKISAKIIMIGTKKYFIKDYIQYAYLKKLKIYFLEATEIPSYTKAWQYNHSSFFLNPRILEESIIKIMQ